ncbi:fucolectin-related molecule [Elysia marginata]|uniref:Fucolectin-related molecule n=1 Tax=Elysia marginata TaxID=1093978 RepID=A0AAV4I1F6_9GAST|nr:fucolectin-related molecule [Elysia marginata]
MRVEEIRSNCSVAVVVIEVVVVVVSEKAVELVVCSSSSSSSSSTSAQFTAFGGTDVDMGWLTDMDDETCNSGTHDDPAVFLKPEVPLTWIRLVVDSADRLKEIRISYQFDLSGDITPCPSNKSKVDSTTLDIVCNTQQVVKKLYLQGSGVAGLCSVYISKGRNVALKQQATQSSKYSQKGWQAENAVDGKLDVPDDVPSQAATCTQTEDHERGWWTLIFTKPVNLYEFHIYNRRNPYTKRDCCEKRLMNFELEVWSNESAKSLFKHIDENTSVEDIYTVIPRTLIWNAKNVTIYAGQGKKILTLCEVEIYGARKCSDGWFGTSCQYQCHCAGSVECDEVDGSCSSGCHSEWFGPACQYKMVPLEDKDSFTDNKDETCAAVGDETVYIWLKTPTPLNWIRLVGNDAEDLSQVQIWNYISGIPEKCSNPRIAKVSHQTIDIECYTQRSVGTIGFGFKRTTRLCSVYVSEDRMGFSAGELEWLTDSNDESCNEGISKTVTVTLDTAIPLTWVRVVVKDGVSLRKIQLRYQLKNSSGEQKCQNQLESEVDKRTRDISCSEVGVVSRVTLSGPGVGDLCTLYISGGRNVALKQSAKQSSKYFPPDVLNAFHAENAVDGRFYTPDTLKFTCTHTVPNPGDNWWTLTFSQPMNVTRFIINNRWGKEKKTSIRR